MDLGNKNKDNQINDENLTKESKSKLEQAKEVKEVDDCKRDNNVSGAWHNVKILAIYTLYILVVIVITYSLSLFESTLINALMIGAFGALFGAMFTQVLISQKK